MPIQFRTLFAPGGRLLDDDSALITGFELTAGEHGDESIRLSVDLPPGEAYRRYDRPGLPHVEALGPGLSLLQSGRLEDVAIRPGGIELNALGYWRALSDIPYTAVWSSVETGRWRPVSTSERGDTQPDRWAGDTTNRLYVTPKKNSTHSNLTGFWWVFQTPDNNPRNIVGMQFKLTHRLPSATWLVQVIPLTTGFSAGAALLSVSGAGTQVITAYHLTFAGTPWIGVRVFYNSGTPISYTSDEGTDVVQLTDVRLVGSTATQVSTTLTVNLNIGIAVATVATTANMYPGQLLIVNAGGASSEIFTVQSVLSATGVQFTTPATNSHPISEPVQGFAVQPDEIARDMLATISAANPGMLSPATARIHASGVDLLNAVYEDADMGQVLTALAALGDASTPPQRYEVGVDAERVLYFRPQGSAGQAWAVDVATLELERTIATLVNSAYAIYEERGGRALRTPVATEPFSVARWGLTRRQAVAADTTNATIAALVRDAAIAGSANPPPRARIPITFFGTLQGAPAPLAACRPGDTITIRNLPATLSTLIADRIRTMRVLRRTYDGALTIEPEGQFPSLTFFLAEAAGGRQ